MPLTFTIVESNWTEEFNNNYKHIKQDYVNDMKVSDIRAKYGLSKGKWGAYRKQLMADGLLQSRKAKNKPKFYTNTKYGFIVQKVINHHKYYIGTFRLESQAQHCVQLMKECNWDFTQKERIIQKVRSK